MIKPDAIHAGNKDKIIELIKQDGFAIIKMKKTQFTKTAAEKFYAIHKNKPFFQKLITFVTSGPVIVIVLQKKNAIQDWRTLMGATNPAQAKEGTIRQLFGTNVTKNAVHGSDSWQTAQQEINQFFPCFNKKVGEL